MPWAGATFNRTDSTRVGASVWVDADSAGVPILPSDHDVHDQDIADGLEETVKHNGDIPMTGPLDMGGNDIAMGGGQIDNAIRINVNTSGIAFKATSIDAGSSPGPQITAARRSPSPAVGDQGGVFKAPFFDSALSEVAGAQFKSRLRNPTAGAVETAWDVVNMDGAGGEATGCILTKDGVEDVGGKLTQSLNSSQLTQQTASGTEVEFSNGVTPGLISADVTQIIITFAGLVHADTGVAHVLSLVLGSTSYAVTGYSYVARRLDAGVSIIAPTTEWVFVGSIEDDPVRGTLVLDRIEGSDTWQITGNVAAVDVPENYLIAGSIALVGKLDRFKLIVGGANSWAGGTVSATVIV